VVQQDTLLIFSSQLRLITLVELSLVVAVAVAVVLVQRPQQVQKVAHFSTLLAEMVVAVALAVVLVERQVRHHQVIVLHKVTQDLRVR
tara:strand:+ start:159 stop:422 length:264 start_codon:yes stop_codon:yes gene_type:complete